MIKRYAVIIDQKVTNVILIDDVDYDNYTSRFDPNTYLFVEVEETPEVAIGWLYTDNEFINMNAITNNEQKIVDEIIQQIANS
jgi:NTP pyrophosphatase (non-canonical NTP hydrolase)